MALLELYGVTDEDHRAELLALARQSDEQSWLRSFPSELPEAYTTYISFEAEARSLLNYECLFVPGLLQTEDYARAALQRGMPRRPQGGDRALGRSPHEQTGRLGQGNTTSALGHRG